LKANDAIVAYNIELEAALSTFSLLKFPHAFRTAIYRVIFVPHGHRIESLIYRTMFKS
jgi:hypothetical protein